VGFSFHTAIKKETIMDAASLKQVTSNLSLGTNALPSENIAGAGPMPTAAPNSGRKLDNSMLGPSNQINNGQGRQYDGAPDHDEDDQALRTSGNGSRGGSFLPSVGDNRP